MSESGKLKGRDVKYARLHVGDGVFQRVFARFAGIPLQRLCDIENEVVWVEQAEYARLIDCASAYGRLPPEERATI